ncbi:phosphatase [Legionella bononiensis]|uniref:Phosphatase n=1 Tax=Legionella bononiensis TaxID=2793102 RepID=A0ABS1W999_9GAMM|nr:phosphatase [Legionella bononiensis]MBL7480904.1 phosphatase [Legionella bononiensis]MBL7525914.1 phosphatase [Legionella bononiensis]MBL7564019.1 phosphatase [Legionella bononiensis]
MRFLLISFIIFSSNLYADTINNYMNIANNIPQMEIKADPQAQAWARSARHVLNITCESIAETLIQANESAKSLGKPIFCLPPGKQLNSITLNELIQQTYKEISSQRSDKDTMTVSQIALLGVSKQFPCQQNPADKQMAHVATLLSH